MWTAEEYLLHHGILGQKWGKQNGPPYPLGASDHSAAEKKAGYRKSLKSDTKDSKESKKKNKPKDQINASEKKSKFKEGLKSIKATIKKHPVLSVLAIGSNQVELILLAHAADKIKNKKNIDRGSAFVMRNQQISMRNLQQESVRQAQHQTQLFNQQNAINMHHM